MVEEANGTSLRGTTARSRPSRGMWLKRLLKTVFWAVWVIGKVLTFVTWLGSSLG